MIKACMQKSVSEVYLNISSCVHIYWKYIHECIGKCIFVSKYLNKCVLKYWNCLSYSEIPRFLNQNEKVKVTFSFEESSLLAISKLSILIKVLVHYLTIFLSNTWDRLMSYGVLSILFVWLCRIFFLCTILMSHERGQSSLFCVFSHFF